MLKFCLSIDCESCISFSQGNPEYTLIQNLKFLINKIAMNLRYNCNGFWVIYDEIKRQRFPCTFMLTGRVYKPVEKLNFIEWGYHTYNHALLNLIPDEIVKKEIKNIYRAKSITCPMWRVEDIRNPGRIFSFLKEEGYRNAVYHGKCMGIKTFYKKQIRKSEERFGIKCIHVSNYFEGNWKRKKIDNIKKDILKNLDREGVYLLTSHDFTHKNAENLKRIIRFVRELENMGKIKAVKLDDAG